MRKKKKKKDGADLTHGNANPVVQVGWWDRVYCQRGRSIAQAKGTALVLVSGTGADWTGRALGGAG